MPSAFPTDSDVNNYLTTLGYEFTARTGTADLAVEKFLDDTGRSPWFAAVETRTYDPPQGRLLYLKGSALEVSSVTFDGQEVESDAWALIPPALIQFTRDIGPYKPQTVTVTGTWGYAAAGINAVPSDAYNAVLYYAAYLTITERLAGQSASSITGAVSRVRHGQVEYEYSDASNEAVGAPGSVLLGLYQSIVSKYTVLIGVT